MLALDNNSLYRGTVLSDLPYDEDLIDIQLEQKELLEQL